MELDYTETHRNAVERKPRYKELMYRRDHGLEVILEWLKRTDTIWIVLNSEEQNLHFQVPNDKGLDAHAHPWAYSPRRAYED